jgi:hypothetical protein
MVSEPATPPAPGGVISANAAYSLDQVKQRLGLGTAALRTARRKGLLVRRVGSRSFILGRDLLDYLENHATIVVGDRP